MRDTRRLALTLLLSSLGFASPPAADASLLHRWDAEGDAVDAVGDDDGTLVGGVGFADGLSGQSFSFDGVDDAVQFGTSSGNFGTGHFTIALLIRMAPTDKVVSVLGKREACLYGSFWDIRSSGAGSSSLEVYDAGVQQNTGVSTGIAVDDGLYHTVVFIREGHVVSAYVDGFFAASHDAGFAADLSNSASLAAGIGACTGKDGTVPLVGTLDEIRLADNADPYLLPAFYHCGDSNQTSSITAADALIALKAAVGSQGCGLCFCDANHSGAVTAGDALAILRAAVGQQVPLDCPLCPFELPA
jgi:hypothetical protein